VDTKHKILLKKGNMKYTDKHIFNDQGLIEVAENYVTYYDGSFAFIEECRERLILGHKLTTQQTRAVLNTMIADPTVVHLPKPKSVIKDYGHFVKQYPSAIPKNDRPFRIQLPVKWHKEYGMSTNPRAEKIHKLDHNSSTIAYYPLLNHKRFEHRFVVQLRWLCSNPIASEHNSYKNTKLLSLFEARQEIFDNHRRWCMQCEEK